VKSRRNIELDNPCHSILRCVFFRQPEESNSDAKVCVDCKWLKIREDRVNQTVPCRTGGSRNERWGASCPPAHQGSLRKNAGTLLLNAC
jgi:hypothetical protein